MGVNSLEFEFGGPLARLLQIDTRYFVKCPTVANLPEGAVRVCARNFVKGPAVRELPGGDDHALTRDLPARPADGPGPSGPCRAPRWPRMLPRTTCRPPRSHASLSS